MLSENAKRTRRHLQADGFPNEWEMKNSLSNKAMMLMTSVLIGGMLGGCISARDGGGPLYITDLFVIVHPRKWAKLVIELR